jgi:preprotein translocase subunit SecG
MLTLVAILIIIVSALLVLIVLIQNPKGGGLSSSFGAASNQFMNVQKTGDLLERLTWGFAIGLIVLCLSTNMAISSSMAPGSGSGSKVVDKMKENGQPEGTQAPQPTQEGGAVQGGDSGATK